MTERVNVVVGTPVCRDKAYVLDKFLANQREIQLVYPSSELVLATNEADFAEELENLLNLWSLKGKVLRYETIKPEYARSPWWNVACGREAIRRYTLSQTEAAYLLCLDVDMTFDPNVISIMEREIQGYDAVYSGYPLRDFGIALAPGGCCLLTVAVAKEIKWRCLEFKNGVAIADDVPLEMDLIRLGKRIKKGFFLSISHYDNQDQAKTISPRPVGLYRRVTHSALVRYVLIRASIALQHDIASWLNLLIHRLLGRVRTGRT